MVNIIITILFFVIFFLVVFIISIISFNILVQILRRKHQVFSRRLYIKEIPITLNYKNIKHAENIGQFGGIVLFTAIISFTFFSNTLPLGITLNYDLNDKTSNISQIGPKNRVKNIIYNGVSVSKITNDLVYFSTYMPFNFDYATVKVIFKNTDLDQTFSLGFQDQSNWHFYTKPFDAPFLNGLNWTRNGYDPVLYQKIQNYKSADDFLANPPHNTIIGKFNYDKDIGNTNISIPNYKPASQETVINTPFRGSQNIYAYLDHEPFHMTIQKQDLNWYANPDTLTVKVFKNNDLVFQTTDNDKIIPDGSGKEIPPTTVNIDNPGPGYPESGVYRIEIDANSDTVIKSISSNLHKIVFANTIFPVENSLTYKNIVATTSATTVYTNALSLSAITFHTVGEQNIKVGNKILSLNTLNIPATIIPPDPLTEVVIPQNDVILNGFQGYFALTPDEFFMPSNYYVMPVYSQNDLSMVDYLITDYLPSHNENGWQVNEQTFDLSSANVLDGRLSWLLESPKLNQNGNSIIIKDIQITFHKNGWL